MSDSFEDKLRRALRPIDPGEDFTQLVVSKLSDAQTQSAESNSPRFGSTTRWIAAIAASMIIAVAIGFGIHERQEREAGLRARQQLLEALQVASEKLNLAYRVVHDQTKQDDTKKADDSGA